MAVTITSTKDAQKDGINILVYGRAGVGKTTLCATAPKPIIISTESGLLSVAKYDIPVIEVAGLSDFENALAWIKKKKNNKHFDTICIDSITDIADVILAQLKQEESNLMRAYGRLADVMSELIRDFRDIKGKHVYMTAKAQRMADDGDSDTVFRPYLPGQQLPLNLPYWFDELLPLRVAGDMGDDGDGDGGYRYLQTQPDSHWDAKDRSDTLAKQEQPHLGKIIKKIKRKLGR